jgi:hypothetical protein
LNHADWRTEVHAILFKALVPVLVCVVKFCMEIGQIPIFLHNFNLLSVNANSFSWLSTS